MTNNLLEIELRLLLLRYSRRRILEALAVLRESTVEEIEAELSLIEERVVSHKPRTTPSATDLVYEMSRARPESIEFLQALAARYDNRTFLPHLRDVQRFLDRIGFAHGQLKSRRAAARHMLTALCRLSVDDLKRLSTHGATTSGDYEMLAREIMGKDSTQRGRSKGEP